MQTYNSIPHPNQRIHPPSPLVGPSQDVTDIVRHGRDAIPGDQVRAFLRVSDILKNFLEKVVQQDEVEWTDITECDVACTLNEIFPGGSGTR